MIFFGFKIKGHGTDYKNREGFYKAKEYQNNTARIARIANKTVSREASKKLAFDLKESTKERWLKIIGLSISLGIVVFLLVNFFTQNQAKEGFYFLGTKKNEQESIGADKLILEQGNKKIEEFLQVEGNLYEKKYLLDEADAIFNGVLKDYQYDKETRVGIAKVAILRCKYFDEACIEAEKQIKASYELKWLEEAILNID